MSTTTRDRILAFVADYIRRHGVSPTIREIANGIGLSSAGSVQWHLAKLKAEGLLSETGGKTRSLIVNSRVNARPGDDAEHHVCLKTSDGGSIFLSFVMREGVPEFNGPYCINGPQSAGDIIACCAMTEEAYASVMDKHLK